ncbi:MAG: prepilin-type N-terminal cleavage/methylation domain-containing protein [Planctomycetaceae bacterium]|nr:prepilin-type N-terminal cleavage/methylation domain-containing protein [Planctomycetaceae bacterium]
MRNNFLPLELDISSGQGRGGGGERLVTRTPTPNPSPVKGEGSSAPAGFTLIELLVVITILLLLTFMVIGVFNLNAGGDKMRAAGRIGQSALLGARDRALHAKAKRGIHFIRDPNNSNLITGFAYLQPIENQVYPQGSFSLERRDAVAPIGVNADSPEIVIVHGVASVDWYNFSPFFAAVPRIRIPAKTGQWYTFYYSNTAGDPYQFTASNQYLQLTTPFIDQGNPYPAVVSHPSLPVSEFNSCEIEMAAELLPNHQPIYLPSGIVIDVANSSNGAQYDLMFSPRGGISGHLSALGPIYLLLRDVQDVTAGINPADYSAGVQHREEAVLTIFPQTGHIQTFPIDPTDANNDGFADDLFHFAKIGSAARS